MIGLEIFAVLLLAGLGVAAIYFSDTLKNWTSGLAGAGGGLLAYVWDAMQVAVKPFYDAVQGTATQAEYVFVAGALLLVLVFMRNASRDARVVE